jgi:nucleoside-diphosphate-sugar epimerase
VDNVVEALVLCGKMPQVTGQVYNLSDHCTLEHFVAIIAELLGCGVPRTRLPELPVRALAKLFGRIPGVPITQTRIDALTTRAIYSNEKIEQELGYRHPLSMEDGLSDLVGYWQSGCNKS